MSGTTSGSAALTGNGTSYADSLFDGAGMRSSGVAPDAYGVRSYTISQSNNASLIVPTGTTSAFLRVYVEAYSEGGGYG